MVQVLALLYDQQAHKILSEKKILLVTFLVKVLFQYASSIMSLSLQASRYVFQPIDLDNSSSHYSDDEDHELTMIANHHQQLQEENRKWYGDIYTPYPHDFRTCEEMDGLNHLYDGLTSVHMIEDAGYDNLSFAMSDDLSMSSDIGHDDLFDENIENDFDGDSVVHSRDIFEVEVDNMEQFIVMTTQTSSQHSVLEPNTITPASSPICVSEVQQNPAISSENKHKINDENRLRNLLWKQSLKSSIFYPNHEQSATVVA
jgi:hypothetical protein